MLKVIAAAVILLALSSVASAAQCDGSGPELKEPVLCSKMFLFHGVCGRPNYDYPGWPDIAFATGAWEKVPIRITKVSADATVYARWHAATARIFSGNSFNNDPMTPYQRSAAGIMDLFGRVILTVRSEAELDPGMQFPAGQPMPSTHLDVHLTCEPSGAQFDGSLSVWYVPDGP